LTVRVTAAEQGLQDMAITVGNLAVQVNNLLAGMATAAETANQNAVSCKELRVTTERMLKSQDNMATKVDAIENQMMHLGTRLTSIEGAISTVLSPASSPNGHREEHDHQGIASEHALVNGTFVSARTQFEPGTSNQHQLQHNRHHRDHLHSEFRMPKTNFPKFDGNHPKLWKEKAEKYFNMFHVPEDYKVDYATLHFTGSAALWLQTYEAQHDIDGWAHLCVAVCQKFAKDLYYADMTKTLSIRQSSDVETYSKEF
jgi:hypothetical protein